MVSIDWENEWAKQLITYADAITAFAVVQTIAFCFLIGQSDFFAKTVKEYWGWTAVLCGAIKGCYAVGVLLCQHYYPLLLKQTGIVAHGEWASVVLWVGVARVAVIVSCAVFGIWMTLAVRSRHPDIGSERTYVEEVAASVRNGAIGARAADQPHHGEPSAEGA